MFFKDKVIWITGASSGIGAELAKQLAKEQARLILTSRNVAALQQVRNECVQYNPNCNLLPADLLIESALEEVTEEATNLFGRIDMVIFSAGVTQRSTAIETPLKIDRQLMEINFFIPVTITKKLLPYFQAQGSGQIVVISSMAGLMGFPLRTAYAASKHALIGFFETLQVEHQLKGFHITIANPGRINTPISMSAVTANGLPYNKMDEGQLKGIPVDECVRKIINAVRKKKKQVIIARGEKILYWIKLLIPGLYYRIARKKGMDQKASPIVK